MCLWYRLDSIWKCIPVCAAKQEALNIAAVKTQKVGHLLFGKDQVTLLQNFHFDNINCFPMKTWKNISTWMLMIFERIT